MGALSYVHRSRRNVDDTKYTAWTVYNSSVGNPIEHTSILVLTKLSESHMGLRVHLYLARPSEQLRAALHLEYDLWSLERWMGPCGD